MGLQVMFYVLTLVYCNAAIDKVYCDAVINNCCCAFRDLQTIDMGVLSGCTMKSQSQHQGLGLCALLLALQGN